MTELKLVKGAILEKKNNFHTIRHYNTEIFTYDEITKIAHTLINCSKTSNVQIKSALKYFDPKDVIVKKNKKKWSYST